MSPSQPSKYWKTFERRIARSVGTERTPLSGGGSKHTRSDTLHDTLYIEAKCRARHSIFTWWRQCVGNAIIEHKTPILALHEKSHVGALAVMEWKYFVHLYERDLELSELRKESQCT